MSDATRDEAIQWCLDNGIDFLQCFGFPPPEGWRWCEPDDQGMRYSLAAVPTNKDNPYIFFNDVVKKRRNLYLRDQCQ